MPSLLVLGSRGSGGSEPISTFPHHAPGEFRDRASELGRMVVTAPIRIHRLAAGTRV